MCKWKLSFSNIDRNGRAKTVKYLSIAFVGIFLLHGLITISICIWLEVSNVTECNFLIDEPYWLAVHIQLSSGCLTVVVCISSVAYTLIRKTNNFIRLFSCLLVIVISLEILSAIVAGVMNRKLSRHLKEGMMGSVQSINSTSYGYHDAVECWRRLQTQYKCCGIDDYTTWVISEASASNVTSHEKMNQAIWNACDCKDQNGNNCDVFKGERKYSSGCYTKLKDKIQFVLTFTRFFGPSFAICQCFAYLTLYVIFSKMYKHSVVAIYKTQDGEGKVSHETCNVSSIS